MYVNWLSMVRSGLMGLEYYTPETKKWRQVCTCAVGKSVWTFIFNVTPVFLTFNEV